MIFTIIFYALTVNANASYVSSIGKNWNNGPIIQAYENICQTDSPLITDSWPGIVLGCAGTNNLYLGRCGKSGRTVAPVPPKPYLTWRTKKICSKKVPATYLDLSIANNENSCPSNQRSCGIIDSFKNVMCVPIETPCPINYLEIIPSNQPFPSGFNFTSIPLDGATLILSNVNTKGKIITDFQVSEDSPCLDSYYKNYLEPIFDLEVYFSRSKCQASIGGELFDKSYELKDTYSFYNVYNENGIFNILTNLAQFLSYKTTLSLSNRKMKLYTRNYIGVNYECFKTIKQNNLSAQLMRDLYFIDDQIRGKDELTVYAIVFGTVGPGAFIIGFILWCVLDCNDESDLKIKLFWHSFICIFICVPLIISCIIISKYNSIGNSYEILFDYNCGDSTMIEGVKNTISTINTINAFAILTLITSSLCVICNIIEWIICCCY